MVLSIIDKIARSYGFDPKTIDGETVWGKGDGVVVKMQFISAAFTDYSVLLSGWTRDIVTGESDLEGFAAIIPKRKMKKMNRISSFFFNVINYASFVRLSFISKI